MQRINSQDRGREGLPPCRGGKNARAPANSRRRGCPLGRPADHGRVRKRDQTNYTALGPVPRLGSRRLREGDDR
eukprot:scaffold3150_cov47-Phaeocystis_antarctica.AAC.1